MADPRLFAVVSRRSFLRYTAVSAGLLTLSQVRLGPVAVASLPDAGFHFLTPHEAEILTAIVERMVFAGEEGMPAVRDTRAVETIDQTITQLDTAVQSQLRWLLQLFQWGPPLLQLKLKTFTGMSPEERDDYIRDWADSRFATRQLAFRALKNLSMLGYYSQDATWAAIHYDGPWAPRPRRVLSAGS